MAGQTITVSVLADTRKFSSAMKNLGDQTGLTKLADKAKKVGKAFAVASAAVAAGAVAFGTKAVSAAGDLEQSIGAIDTVFKDNAKTVHKWAKSADKDLGLSRNAYNELATLIGTQLKNGGTAIDQIGGKTNELITLGADLSSMFGGDTKTAVEALSSALKGERDPIEKYGVSLNQAKIDAEAAALGFEKVGNSLSAEAQQAATLSLITKQTADAHGNFAKEANTLQGQQQRLRAKFENITATLGMHLLPIVTKVTGWVSDRLGPAFTAVSSWVQAKGTPLLRRLSAWWADNGDKVKDLAARARDLAGKALGALLTGLKAVAAALAAAGGWIVKNRDWLAALAITIGTMVAGWQGYLKVMAIWKAGVALWTAAQVAFNAVMAANPIGLIILAVAGLVAGLTFFFTKTETGKKIWAGFTDALAKGWEAIKNAFAKGYATVKGWLEKAWAVIKKVWSYSPLGLIVTNWNKIISWFKGIPGKVKGIFSGAINWLVSAGKNIFNGFKNGYLLIWGTVWTWLKERGTKIKEAFSNAVNWLVSSGKNVLSGLKNGLAERWTAVMTWFKEIPGKVKAVFANAGTWLLNAGKQVIQGFINGLKQSFGNVKSTLGDLTSKLTSWKGPESLDKVILRDAGALVIGGFVDGLKSEFGTVKRTLGDLTKEVARTDMGTLDGPTVGSPTLALAGTTAARSSQATGSVYNITVQALAPTPEIGRAVLDAIRQHERLNGARR